MNQIMVKNAPILGVIRYWLVFGLNEQNLYKNVSIFYVYYFPMLQKTSIKNCFISLNFYGKFSFKKWNLM